jgi:hypothetical protein
MRNYASDDGFLIQNKGIEIIIKMKIYIYMHCAVLEYD